MYFRLEREILARYTLMINSTPQPTEDTRLSPHTASARSAAHPHPLDPTARRAALRALRAEKIVRWLSRSPFFDPFCTLLRPVIQWLLGPTNAVVAGLILILSPFIALLLLPLLIILVPVVLGIAGLAIVFNSMKIESEQHQEVYLPDPAKA